jgi:hypothetical protein
MHFVNGAELDETVDREKWHHSALSGFIELSPPLDIRYVCDNKQWDTITVERTFLNSLASISSSVWTNFYIDLYSPWAIYYECRESID